MSLSCEEVELSLLEPERSEDVRAHLAGCEKCRAFEKDLTAVESLAALPELSGAEKAKLLGLAPRTLSAVRAQQSRGSFIRRAAGLAVAAGLGALVTGVALRGGGEQPVTAPRPELVSDASLDVPLVLVDDGVMADSDDDVEIAWPTLEGEVP
jgi:anti-sigma factor RsiW